MDIVNRNPAARLEERHEQHAVERAQNFAQPFDLRLEMTAQSRVAAAYNDVRPEEAAVVRRR